MSVNTGRKIVLAIHYNTLLSGWNFDSVDREVGLVSVILNSNIMSLQKKKKKKKKQYSDSWR